MRMFALLLAVCAAGTLDWTTARAATPGAVAQAGTEIRLQHISVVKSGTGPALVLIPGLSTPRDVWSQFLPRLAQGHTVYAVQINGFGGDAPGENHRGPILTAVVDELHGFLASERSGPAKIVGHSLGGLLAMMLAAEHRSDVSALMIVDSFPFAGVMFDEKATPETVRPFAAMLKSRMEKGYSGAQGEAAAAATADGLTATAASATQVKAWMLKADPKVAASAMAEDLVTDMRPRLATLAVPITVVHPAEALGKPAQATAAFYRDQFAAARDVRFEPVAGSGHFVMLDQPERFGALLWAFAD